MRKKKTVYISLRHKRKVVLFWRTRLRNVRSNFEFNMNLCAYGKRKMYTVFFYDKLSLDQFMLVIETGDGVFSLKRIWILVVFYLRCWISMLALRKDAKK